MLSVYDRIISSRPRCIEIGIISVIVTMAMASLFLLFGSVGLKIGASGIVPLIPSIIFFCNLDA